MQETMVRPAQEEQPVGRVVSALGPRDHVVDFEEGDVPAAGDAAPPAVPPDDGPPHRRRDGLRGARGAARTHVGADPLRVARGALGNLAAHLDARAASVLPRTARLCAGQRRAIRPATRRAAVANVSHSGKRLTTR